MLRLVPTHVFTGATGFVGSAIVLELLERDPRAEVLAIVRPGEIEPSIRLRETLHKVARLYALESAQGVEIHTAIDQRCHAIAGDLFEPACGVHLDDSRPWEGAEFWHCAASLQYQDRHADNIYRTNTQGTEHALDLARRAGARCFNYISTAYVAGTRSGPILEQPVEEGHNNNHYERSKVRAEQMVQSESTMRTRILRPSIVIGHSKTRAALNFNGMYGFLRGLVKFRGAMERAQRSLAARLDVRVRADRHGTVNLIPVDHVARDAARLSLRDAPEGIYHLTTATPINTGSTLDTLFELAGFRRPKLVQTCDEFSSLDARFHRRVDFYTAYLVGPKQFSRAHTNAAAGTDEGGTFVLDTDTLTDFCNWYVERLEARRSVLPATR